MVLYQCPEEPLNGTDDQRDNVQSVEVSYLNYKRWKRKEIK